MMKVICENCKTVYRLEAVVLGVTGFNVQCKKCKYSWFQKPEPEPIIVKIHYENNKKSIEQWLKTNNIEYFTMKDFRSEVLNNRNKLNIIYPEGCIDEMDEVLASIRRILDEHNEEYIFTDKNKAMMFKMRWT